MSNTRIPTVYDAVAGRVFTKGHIQRYDSALSQRDGAAAPPPSHRAAIAPENVLFRRPNAPTRYAEFDIYFAHEGLDVSKLPDSDLLKALHTYATDFYSRATHNGGIEDWKSMDETALIALGILMEELALEILGETGDLALTEGEPFITTQASLSDIAPSSFSSLGRARKRRRAE